MRGMGWITLAAALGCAGATTSPATPGEPKAATPVFAPPAGTYATAQSVTVSCATAGATLRCTLDGSAPDAGSAPCPDPIAVASTTTIRAIATAPGRAPSDVATALFTIQPGATRAATPAFTPRPGAYATAQTVTITSSTAGATIRCTLDGTAATAASPTCADPIPVTTTTTIRAVATAPGRTVSLEATATYRIGAPDPPVFDCLLALSTSRQLFSHQSVGNNIVYGPSAGGGGGLDDITKGHAAAGVSVISEPSGIGQLPRGGWAETGVGSNGDPAGKIDDFDHQVRTRFSGQLDYAAFKFCFADFGEGMDIGPVWTRYQAVMDQLERDHPGRIIHWTVPVMPDVSDIAGNTTREALSNLIRGKYASTGRLFDLADLEAHDDAGNLVTLGGVRALWTGWSADGQYDGHLNYAGAHRIALAYIQLMCAVQGGR